MTDATVLEDFRTSEEEYDSDEPVAKKKRGPNRVWFKTQEFDDAAAADEEVFRRKVWVKSSRQRTEAGTKVLYRCTGGQYRRQECPAGLYLLFHSNNSKVSLFETECEHEHHVNEARRGLSTEMKEFVATKFLEGIEKPNAMLSVIRRMKMTEPDKSKLIVYLRTLRIEKHGAPSVSGNEIREWCTEHSLIPEDEDMPFVLEYFIAAESMNVEEQDLKIVISTRRLLNFSTYSDCLQADATYKLTWQGYPVLIMGCSDKNNVFYPSCLAVCKGESAADYAFVFGAIRQHNAQCQPSILMADASEAITAGFESVFGAPKVRLQCFFHVRKNIEKYLKILTKGGICGHIIADLNCLQMCISEVTFDKASELFIAKWKAQKDTRIQEFANYFHSQWLMKNSAWYEGAALGYPSTNNGLEATNAVIKREETIRERLPVGQFFVRAKEIVQKWSETRKPSSANCKKFSTNRTIQLAEWTKGFHWAVQNMKVLQRKQTNSTLYYTAATGCAPITSERLTQFLQKQNKWTSFDDFKAECLSIWVITIFPSKLSDCMCTCPYFSKRCTCKHVLGMQIRLKLVVVPEEAKNIPLGQKRKWGRPSKARKALLMQ